MARQTRPTKSTNKTKSKPSSTPTQTVEASTASQASRGSQRIRAKNYTTDEAEALVKVCSKFHTIINKNSSSEGDKKLKEKAWNQIKSDFDKHCRSQGIYVSHIYV